LLARATITSMGGLRLSMRASHGCVVEPLRIAQRTVALAPMISNPIEQVFAKLKHLLRKAAVCVLDREGVVLYESTTASTAEAIADELPKRQVVVASYSRRGEWRRSCFTG
jgi:hypothetical protein